MPLTEKQWTLLAQDLRRALGRVAPEWTDHETHDPGITLLEALAYALTELQGRRAALDDAGRRLAQRVSERASALAGSSSGIGSCGGGLQRVNFAQGMLLTAEDLRAEQSYVLDKLHRRNRLLHGTGIVSGLAVGVERDGSGSRVVIAPGLAFGPSGEEIFVDQPVPLALPAQGRSLMVLLRYAERPCLPVPVPGSDSTDAQGMQNTRIAEAFSAALAPAPAPDAVAIARLACLRSRWRIDAAFEPPRIRAT